MEEQRKTEGIPSTAEIMLESCRDQWELFARGTVTSFRTKALVTPDKAADRKVRITVVMQTIARPGQFCPSTVNVLRESRGLDETKSKGVTRANQFLSDQIDRTTWLFIGYIAGKTSVPVIILHYEKFNYSVYSVIRDEDEVRGYFPDGVPHVDPSLN